VNLLIKGKCFYSLKEELYIECLEFGDINLKDYLLKADQIPVKYKLVMIN